jgi:hypothetical protein
VNASRPQENPQLDPAPILMRPDDQGMAEAFGRDPILEAMIRQLVAEQKIRTVVETGSWRGYTTRRFSEFVNNVFTIESDSALQFAARQTLVDRANAVVITGRSQNMLPALMPGLFKPILYYLDAHWENDWPILDELKAIADLDDRCCIIIHDCKVPGCPGLGFDSYAGQELTFEFVKPMLDRLRFPWRHYFNDDSAQGHRRGALFVVPSAGPTAAHSC